MCVPNKMTTIHPLMNYQTTLELLIYPFILVLHTALLTVIVHLDLLC